VFVQNPILWLISNLVGAYTFIVFAYLVTQLLVQFGYADRRHQITIFIMNMGRAVVEPALRPIRRFVPPISNIDFSPIVLLLGLQFSVNALGWTLFKLGLG